MVGTTLVEIREHIEALASDDGEYYIICGRTGDRPVPAVGNRFEGRATARSAARATEQYRTALRRYDPHVPYYDLIVCQDTGPVTLAASPQQSQNLEAQTLSEPILDNGSRDPEHRQLVEFCHNVAAAVFETLSDDGYDAVETVVMDAYFELAETVADPDELCLCLRESMAMKLDQQLTPAEQSEVLAEAGTRLSPVESADQPVSATLSVLEEHGLLGSYTQSPWSIDLDDGTRSVVIQLSEYAFSPQHDQLPVLPIVLELHRHQPVWRPSSLDVVDTEDGWRLTLVQARETKPSGLASVPIQSEG